MHSDHLKAECRRLHRLGRTNRQIADELVVPYGTIGHWIYNDRQRGLLDPYVDFDLQECPRCQEEPQPPRDPVAYGYLLGQYLGDGHIVVTPRTTILRIFCCDAYQSVLDECYVAMQRTLARRVHLVHKTGCTAVCSYQRHWTCLFPQHGPGTKSSRRIALEPWQRELIKVDPRPFVRGLIHSDGCRVVNHTTHNGKRYEYPRYHFTNMSIDIMELCGWAFDLLEVEWRWSNHKNLSVAKRASVAVLDGFIGPKTLRAPGLRPGALSRLWGYFLADPMKAKSMPISARKPPTAAA